MREVLIWWRDKSKEEKKAIMKDHNVSVVTYDFIQKLYLKPL